MLLPGERTLHRRTNLGRHSILDPLVELCTLALDPPRLVGTRVHRADAAIHEELNDAASLGGMMDATIQFRPTAAGEESVGAEQVGHGDAAQAATHSPECIAP